MRLVVIQMKTFLNYWLIAVLLLIGGVGCETSSQSQVIKPIATSRLKPNDTEPDYSIEIGELAKIGKPIDLIGDKESAFLAGHILLLDQAVEQAIQQGKLPGGVIWFQHKQDVYHRSYGQRSVAPQKEIMTDDTVFDAASLTKVIATTPSIMKLVEMKQVAIDAPVTQYIPEFSAHDKSAVSIRHLMTHTSGLRPGLSLGDPWEGAPEAIHRACQESLVTPPGTKFKYSDINFILLGEIVHRVSGKPLHQFASEEVFQPLRMDHTRFLPPADWIQKTAPTTKLNDSYIRGVVHDPTSRRMGGVAGHAGLFTCASDLARFARMMLGQGEVDGVRVFKPETITLMTSIQSPIDVPEKRGLGWDIDSPYSSPRGYHFPIGSYGHTGWTGTSIWIVPQTDTFLIFLSNRNHPTEDGTVVALRRTLATIAADSIPGAFNDNRQAV
ncbi:MAG: beta-lactamase family protein, partial [Verrucomicrobia bacterium]|nr:beta-lactamase family protein [Verrucomicrobiota bacterium]